MLKKIAFFTITFALMMSFQVSANERCSKVVEVGICWSGAQAVVAQMENGDQIYLGDADDEVTKVRKNIAFISKATGEIVCYRPHDPRTVCMVNRYDPEWWVLGGSIW